MGRVVVSIDAELAWGFHDLEQPPERRVRRARRGWRRLLEWLDAYEIPATWAVVGHLFLEECDGRHASHPAAADDWFERDPGGKADEHDRWFGPDLIERIQDAEADHEIGCHSFSHLQFDPTAIDREVAEAELEACLDVAQEWGVALESFVFPRNVVGYRDVLAEYDVTCYRGVEPSRWYDGSWWYPLGKFASYSAGRTAPPLVSPTLDEYGLVNVPGSLCLFSFEGLARSVVEPVAGDPVLRKAKLGIDAAAERDATCHLWLHPNDLTTARNVRRLRRVLEYVDEQRHNGDLRVQTMSEAATDALAEPREPKLVPPTSEPEQGLESDVETTVTAESWKR
ncbi:polysaccharide deacetylase family protein [Natronobacterium gregoryi]|uniref:Polysaccharide deacetylase n=2 Tax=Natronobacterium gregoryi TaxID=44930 RepID=L0AKQ1_NATGS|nr:polysaccharide deacetylase family protein [Natronobacterium gregoryi]AFZ74386.1 putative xylanase/chitin deacetylase [Natronobacterium gregoryi SP2]ELY74109.1 polysaccharide deacetylase [Natronobacterium gregoryi SP2]PLK22104.1 polysaccharide deacetylase [Natronobacterium gregoryi SP2]SFJ61412.1 Polysaccharide deacetylase [Natronobacterium gregoryi]